MFGLSGLELFVLFIVFAPFIVNTRLAISRGKDVALMLLLTFIFSWIVTLILAFLPEKKRPESAIYNIIEKHLAVDNDNPKKYKDYNTEDLKEKIKCPFCGQTTYAGLIHCAWCENLISDVVPNQP